MVIDKIENYNLYANLTERLAKGFEFIINTDLVQIEPGTYEIENKAVLPLFRTMIQKKKRLCTRRSY
jgi:beta-galactosidase beta subunit